MSNYRNLSQKQITEIEGRYSGRVDQKRSYARTDNGVAFDFFIRFENENGLLYLDASRRFGATLSKIGF